MSEAGIRSAAAQILQRGIDLDTKKKRYTESLICYQEGIQMLMNSLKDLNNAEEKKALRIKIESYMDRAEKVKKLIEEQKASGNYHEQILIENGSTGHSYNSVFGRFLDSDVKAIVIEDPYIRSFHQCQNFLRLCELLIKSCKNLRLMKLVTSEDNPNSEQKKWLHNIKSDLLSYEVTLNVEFSTTLHDRQIKLNTGWIIKIGRGLDYFKPPDGKFSLGFFDLDLRPCHETTVDVFHAKDVRQSHR